MGTLYFLNEKAKMWHAKCPVLDLKIVIKQAQQPLYEVFCTELWTGAKLLTAKALLGLEMDGGYSTWSRPLRPDEGAQLPFMDRQSIMDLLMSLKSL